MYIIRDREAGNEIERSTTIEQACDQLTEYVVTDENEKYTANEIYDSDPYETNERRESIMNFYEIYNDETKESVNIYWDINDNCVCWK